MNQLLFVLMNLIIALSLTVGVIMVIYFASINYKSRAFFFIIFRQFKVVWVMITSFALELSKMMNFARRGNKAYDFYEKMLLYANMSVTKFFNIKNALLFGTVVVLIATKVTNISAYTKEMYRTFDFAKGLTTEVKKYTDEQKAEILEAKNQYFEITKDQMTKEMMASPQAAKRRIEDIVRSRGNSTGIKEEVLAEELYQRIQHYNDIRTINFGMYLFFCIFMYFLPEIGMYFFNFFNKTGASSEKRFLKRLIIMNGSIKPTDFMMVLDELIDKSKYYTKILKDIQDANKKNYQDNSKIYAKYIKESKDIETKLFYEKLDEANNYDFDQAIENIKNEFNLDKRAQLRKTKKMVETIHVWGIIGFMLLIVLLVLYLLLPWLSAYDLDSMVV